MIMNHYCYHLIYKKQVEELLIDGYLTYLNYLYSLANVKMHDVKVNDIVNNLLKVKESDKEEIQKFNNEHPVLDDIETQVKVQDANNTRAQASINAAIEELGTNASSEEIKKRSLEILNDTTPSKSK